MNSLSLKNLHKAATKIKITGRCINSAILTLKCQVQIIASCFCHLFGKYAKQSLFIKVLMISDGMSILWITLNLLDLQSFLILIFVGVRFDHNGSITSKDEFRQVTAMINPVTVAQFFEDICTEIFKLFLAVESIKNSLLGLVSTYFGTVETNSQVMLYLHFLL